jgi:hypothetical protein
MREEQIEEIDQNAMMLFPLLKHLFNGYLSESSLIPLRNQTYNILRILE